MQLSNDRNGLVRLEYRIVAPQIVERRQDAELSLGMFMNVIRECCGTRWAPEEVHFEHPKPAAAREHEAAFGAPVAEATIVGAVRSIDNRRPANT